MRNKETYYRETQRETETEREQGQNKDGILPVFDLSLLSFSPSLAVVRGKKGKESQTCYSSPPLTAILAPVSLKSLSTS